MDESLDGMVRWHARHRADASAVICGDARRSYSELYDRSGRLAAGLLATGLKPGDRVAILLPNCIEYLELYLAAARSGLPLVPINAALTGPEIAYILEDSGAALVIAADGLDVPEGLPVIRDLAALIDGGSALEAVVPGPDAVFFQGYTSGTTGRPKGCVQTLGAFVEHFRRSFGLYRHDADDVMLMPGPLFHEAPALFSLAQLYYGGTVLLLSRFDAATALTEIGTHRATTIGFAVPTMLDRMIPAAREHDTSSLRSIVTAGAPLHPETREGTLRAFPTAALHEFYGGTEIGIITNIEHRAGRAFGSSVGTAVPGFDVVLLDETDQPVAPGEVGLIYVSPIMMAGYHGRPQATADATRTLDGVDWLTLGDLGRLDEDGHLYLVDRKSHMIITGGENVYPAEVEAVLAEHPAIDDVAVIGLPDADWGEAVTAVIATTGEAPDLDSVRTFARARLAGYKTPRRVVIVDEIPRTASGKILKHRLRNDLAGGEPPSEPGGR
ncbi:class I adenylate-forming enzyme family protein [Cryptosporangium phraense]|uniref:Long-chain fatty acid--CoA ligase n=1 Tax=Cryptosporangium phraense TaxID=2593070 RepID=A0A545AXX1_9ACTN|nr:AMP-binding protein [Cryptosporangium phraense]TQS46148.1 long-chain fatty acid--CoA ligase [Cryptosporangium phraense]